MVRVNDRAIQLKSTASILNSRSIEGRAMLIDEPMKGHEKFATVLTISTTLFMVFARRNSSSASFLIPDQPHRFFDSSLLKQLRPRNFKDITFLFHELGPILKEKILNYMTML